MVSGLTLEYRIGGVPVEDAFQRMQVAFERAGDAVVQFDQYVFPRLVPVFENYAEGQFSTEGHGPNTGAWAQLSRKYAEWKDRHFPGKGILERSGALRGALASSSSPFAVRDVSSEGLTYGTRSLVYAGYHQSGTRFMPARPPFDFDSALEAAVTNAAQEGVRDALTSSGIEEVAEVH